MNTMIIKKTRTGAKLHRGSHGSVMSYCGIRVVAEVPCTRVTVALSVHLCGSCFPAAQIYAAVGKAFYFGA